ncbi:MAG: putative lipid II flippase FtsW [Patescibacteria group bacterium]|jgi:cell division protein FtsW
MRTHGADRILLVTTFLLVAVGLFIVASASSGLSLKEFGTPYYFFIHQLVAGAGVGLSLLFVMRMIPFQRWKRVAPFLLIGSIFLMALLFIPGIGIAHGGATRWVDAKFFTFQPSEILKFTFLLYLASWLAAKKKEIGTMHLGLMPFLVMMGFAGAFLVLEPDVGTLGVLSLSAAALFFLGGGRLAHLGLIIFLGLLVLGALIYTEPYRFSRLAVFLNPSLDTQGIGYQLHQSFVAIGSGGLAGKGFGFSFQKLHLLPEPASDSVFAIVAEESGFVGSVILLALFLVFFWRGIMIAQKSKDQFAKLLASGLTLLVFMQAVINTGSLLGLLPLTGIPLPFISYGGTSLAMHLAQVGILLNISKHTQKL